MSASARTSSSISSWVPWARRTRRWRRPTAQHTCAAHEGVCAEPRQGWCGRRQRARLGAERGARRRARRVVDAHDEHRRVGGRRGDDHLLGAALDVQPRLLLRREDARALDDEVGAGPAGRTGVGAVLFARAGRQLRTCPTGWPTGPSRRTRPRCCRRAPGRCRCGSPAAEHYWTSVDRWRPRSRKGGPACKHAPCPGSGRG